MSRKISYKEIFYYSINITFLLYVLVILGITQFAPKYLVFFREFLKLFIGFLLVIFYNPFIKFHKKIDITDRKIFFSSGLLLILSSVFYTYIENKFYQVTGNFLNTKNIFSL
jgi:hypothetical protein